MSLLNKELLIEIRDLLKEIRDIGFLSHKSNIRNLNDNRNHHIKRIKHELKLLEEKEDE